VPTELATEPPDVETGRSRLLAPDEELQFSREGAFALLLSLKLGAQGIRGIAAGDFVDQAP
jgi:hypothetical protein